MIIKTTANLDMKINGRICEAAEVCGVTPKQFAQLLLKIMNKEKSVSFRSFSPVQYQRKVEGGEWYCFHLDLDEGVYEACLDMRKLMKRSVSFLLSIAVREYLDRAVDEILRGEASDKYPVIYFQFLTHSLETSTFTIFHTFPTRKELAARLKNTG